MEFYGIEMKGIFTLEILPTTPDYETDDEGRLIYVNDIETLLYGGTTDWIICGENLAASLQEIIDSIIDNRYITPLKLSQIKCTSSDVLIGTDNLKYITPLALRGLKASIAESQAGIDDIKYVTPAGLNSSLGQFIESNPGVPAGAIIYYSKNTPPEGFLKANGAAISRTTYSSLFSVIGTTFGIGDGSTTFNLPDLRGRFIRSWCDDGSIDAGRVFGSFQLDEFKSHNHVVGPYSGITINQNKSEPWESQGIQGSQYTSTVGGSETRPTNIALLACIKY